MLVGQLQHAVREGRREHHVEAVLRCRQPAHDVTDVLDEAQVEHAVGLVEYQHLDVLQPVDALLEVVDQPARRADQHVDARLDVGALFLVVGAAVGQAEHESRVGAQQLGILVDLDGQLAGGGEDQAARIGEVARRSRRCSFEMGEHRDQEGGCLAGAGLGLAGDIAALEGHRKRFGLDRRAAVKARFLDPFFNVLRQFQLAEAKLGK